MKSNEKKELLQTIKQVLNLMDYEAVQIQREGKEPEIPWSAPAKKKASYDDMTVKELEAALEEASLEEREESNAVNRIVQKATEALNGMKPNDLTRNLYNAQNTNVPKAIPNLVKVNSERLEAARAKALFIRKKLNSARAEELAKEIRTIDAGVSEVSVETINSRQHLVIKVVDGEKEEKRDGDEEGTLEPVSGTLTK